MLPQAAERLDTRREIRARRGAGAGGAAQPRRRVVPAARGQAHARPVDGDAVRERCSRSSAARGKMQNPVTGSGGMLVGGVEEVGRTPRSGWAGRPVATLVSLTLTPLVIEDGLPRGTAGRAGPGRRLRDPVRPLIAAVLPDDLPGALALAVMDVCGAPALTERRRRGTSARRGGRSGAQGSPGRCLAARDGPAPGAPSGSYPTRRRPTCCAEAAASPTRSSSPTPATRRPARRRRRRRRSRRPHRRLRRRPRLRGRCDPVHRRRRHRHLLLDGHLVQRGGSRRRGTGRRRHDAGGQRLRPRPRGDALDARVRRGVAHCSSGGCTDGSTTQAHPATKAAS